MSDVGCRMCSQVQARAHSRMEDDGLQMADDGCALRRGRGHTGGWRMANGKWRMMDVHSGAGTGIQLDGGGRMTDEHSGDIIVYSHTHMLNSLHTNTSYNFCFLGRSCTKRLAKAWATASGWDSSPILISTAIWVWGEAKSPVLKESGGQRRRRAARASSSPQPCPSCHVSLTDRPLAGTLS